MKIHINAFLLSIAVLFGLQLHSEAQIALLKDYANNNSAAIGTFQGINFREAGFSGLFPIANTKGKEFWTVSDRGVNVDAASANLPACRPTYDKIYSFPNYAPKIHRIRVNGDSIQILQTITMKRPGGTTASGLINPTGLGSTALEVPSIDTVLNCANFNAKTVSKDVWGIDSEGIVVDKDGYFWICEEGGPTIWKLNANGVVVKRYTPYSLGLQAEDVLIDTVFKYRKNNRGFEGIAITPNGNIYAFIQSPLLFPNKTTGEASRVHRILEINPTTNATRVFVYLNQGPIGTASDIRFRDWKIGDMAAINNNEFLVLEAAARGTKDVRKIYKIDISAATAVTSDLYGGTRLEAQDSTTLRANGVTMVTKTLFMDLLTNNWPVALEKAEGLAIINDSTIAICNDNDFGQSSPSENGVATATTNKSHLITYGLKGSNKLANFRAVSYGALYGETGPSTSTTPYLLPSVDGAKFTSILTVGDAVGAYKMCGTPDGAGAFDNGDGTFTLLLNHEFRVTQGVVRAHGTIGAFVSKWVINKSDLSVVSGADLIQNVKLWNGTGYTIHNALNPAPAPMGRFCSADLPPVAAFYNSATGLGTQERIFLNGEEDGTEGRAFGHIATGTNAGTTYQLPHLGRLNIENSVASPASGNKTVVVALEDATPGQVYVYIGTKTNTGTEIDKAGLANGKLFGVAVNSLLTESNASVPTPGTVFTMVDLGSVENMTGATLNTNSNNAGVTTFLRPEDGAWDPSNPNDFYFVTTASFSEPSRMWRLRFTDVANPETGGTIEAVLDGTEGQINLDNMGIDQHGHVLAQEDVGNQVHIGKVFQYTIATDQFKEVAKHDETRFLTGGANFLTQDEESSGIIDVQEILGAGYFLLVDQAHYALPGELVEGGQILSFYNPDTYAASITGPSTSSTPYLIPTVPNAAFNSILTAGDVVGSYKMVGLPDGLGAYDNGNGTFTVLMNHEVGNTLGVNRAHGQKGAFVSKWVINKSDLSVVSGADLIQNVKLWNGTSYDTYNAGTPSALTAFTRFCSADLPAVSAFYNSTTGLGTQERIFMNGEESGTEGRAFAHISTGPNAGTTYEVPALGKSSWENQVACPTSGDKTVVIGMDDATPGQVYVYVGTKNNSGTEIDKAGLSNGKLFGVTVTGLTTEVSVSVPTAGTTFTLFDLGNVSNLTGTTINTNSNNAGVTTFLRPEDGAWDPSNPKDFYFVTTNAFANPSRLWRLRFTDEKNPELGGTIEAVLDGTEGQKMFDNLTVDHYGHIILVEDVGNNVHLGKVWQYTIATDALLQVGGHDDTRFLTGGANFLTQDEEASGVIDVQAILGAGMFLTVDQAHYTVAGEQVEGGQLLSFYNPDTYSANPEVALVGNTMDIVDGDLVPSTTDNTDFGSITAATTTTKTFNINNEGPGTLTLTSMSFTGTNAASFAFVNQPVFPLTIAASGTQAITVQFAPTAIGNYTSTLNIVSNDFDEATYNVALKGNAASATGVDDAQASTFVNVFPNPCGDATFVSMSLQNEDHIVIRVFDVQGQEVLTALDQNASQGEQQFAINTSTLKNGVYFIKVSSSTKTQSIKTVVVH